MQNLGLNMLNGNLRNTNLNNQCQKTYSAVNNLKANTQAVFTGKKDYFNYGTFSTKEIINGDSESKITQEKARHRAKWLYEKAKNEDTSYKVGASRAQNPQKNVEIISYTQYDVFSGEAIQEKIYYYKGEPYKYLIGNENNLKFDYYPNNWEYSDISYDKCFTFCENNPAKPKSNVIKRLFKKLFRNSN